VLVSQGPALKGLVSLLLGLFIATVGLDPLTGQMRFTLGMPELAGGFGIVPVLIGLFAVGEVLRFAVRPAEIQPPPRTPMRHILRGLMPELWKYRMSVLRGSGLGSGIGVLPGVGADISPYVSYALARRLSRTPEKFGTGHVEGIASATAANNASLSSAYVPTLVFGIPGDSLTAMIIGVLYMKGLDPGPTAFVQQPAAIYGIFIVFILANLLMVPLGLATMGLLRRVLDVPRRILMPVILIFCMIGSFAVENTVTAIYVTIAFGVLGFVLESFRYPLAPVILGIVLGPLVEDRFITSMQFSHGDLLGFFERPIAAVLGVITLSLWAFMLYGMVRDVIRRRRNQVALGEGASP
jgi:TctA family transporter